MTDIPLDRDGHIAMTIDIVAAYVSNNPVPAPALPALIGSIHAALGRLGRGADAEEAMPQKPTPAEIRKSVAPEGLVSFVDGKTYKTLRRHLTKHGLTQRSYCERYGLPTDYPMTAPSYSARRADLARAIGLGQKASSVASQPVEAAPAATPRQRGRRKTSA